MAKTNSLTSHHGESNARGMTKMGAWHKRHKKKKIEKLLTSSKKVHPNIPDENLIEHLTMKNKSKRFIKKFYKKKRRMMLRNIENYTKLGLEEPYESYD
jgi:hypothetical protein